MPIPQSVQDKLRKRQVVPFVGAGVSMSVLDRSSGQPVFPSWRQLLNGAADRLDKEMKTAEAELVRALLKIQRPDFLYAAQQVREALGGVWFEFLREALAIPYQRIDETSLELASSVWRLGSNLVITTNYDEVLRWASPQQGDLQSWDIEAPVQQALLLRGELLHPVIWHLHGRISNPSDMILSRDGYELLYPEANRATREAHYDAALATLRQLAIAKSFLFVGFSLDDAHLGFQLKSVHDMYEGAGQHYALVQERDTERIRNLKMGIEPIIFNHFGEPLLALLKELEEVAALREAPDVQTTSSERAIVIPDYGPHRSVFYVPFKQKGDEIVGQQDVLANVRKQLTEGKRTAIGQTAAFRGLGGLGKTQLAIEYAYRYRDEYPNGVIWLNADQDIDAQLIEIGEKARWIAPQSDHKYKIEIAQQRIRSYSDCLIVFDNLDDHSAIEPYLPEPEANPHILVTSRTDHADFYPVPLDLLSDELSRKLLLKEARREPGNESEETAAQGIVALLGGLPLALELAGAYLAHRRVVTFQQYYELLTQDLKNALPKAVSSFTKHEADLYSTLRLSEELLKEEPGLREVLDVLTWSGSAPMSSDLMSRLLEMPNDAALGSALALGVELRLLQRSKESESYSLHRLVGEVRRGEIPLDDRLEWVDAICTRLGNWFQEKRKDFSQLKEFESEIDHLKRWQENALQFAPSHSSRLMWLQAYPSYHRGYYVEARNCVSAAQTLFEDVGETNRELQANLLHDLAASNSVLGAFRSVLSDYMEALSIRRELFGERHSDIALTLENIAFVYGEQADFQRALDYSEKALTMRRELFGEPHSKIADSLNNLGRWHGELGDIERALKYCERALAMRQELFGKLHPAVALSLGSIGRWQGRRGNLKEALSSLTQCVAVLHELFGERHPEIATALHNIGYAYGKEGDAEPALDYSERALNMDREIYGERHPTTAKAAKQVAIYLMRLKRREEAYDLVARFLNVGVQGAVRDELKHLERQLLAKPLRPGFRQEAKIGKRKTKKKKR